MTETPGPKTGSTRAKLTVLSGWAAFALGAACLVGWITGLRTLASLRSEFIPMAPDTGLLFMALGAVLFSGAYKKGRGFGRSLAFAFAILASCYGALKSAETLLGVDLTFQNALFPDTERLGAIVLGRMSPVTGVLFFLSGLSLLLHLIGRLRRLPREAASGIGAVVFVAGGIAATGYLFGTPFLYGGATVPLAANTAAAFIFLGLGLTAAAGEDSVLMRELSGPSARARLLRGILPIIVLAILLQGLLDTRLARVFKINQALLSAILMLALLVATVVIVVRITESVFRSAELAESKRRGAEEQLLIKQAAVDSSMSAIGLASMDGILIYANKAYLDLWGGGRGDDLLGKPLMDFSGHEESVQEVVGALMAGKGFIGERVARLMDGREIVVQMTANVVTSPDGRPMCMMASFIDVTERARAEEALRRSEERFRQIAENEGDFIWEVDTDGLYTYANPVVGKILGYRPEELVGKLHFYDLFAPEVQEELKAGALAAFAAKAAFQAFVNPNLRRDGARVILETSGSPILDGAGSLLGYRGSDKDITDRVAAEEALRDSVKQKEILMKELQHRVKNSLA
ncbi:MAG: multi-sensor hybrid histidine kinase, partial [Candidatus Aminicenantes bacterium]|nr:multi-sensor hybrid histidine kinase [Candidatus Aminicenantes bacterium]